MQSLNPSLNPSHQPPARPSMWQNPLLWLVIAVTSPLWLAVAWVVFCLIVVTAPFWGPAAMGAFITVAAVQPKRGAAKGRRRSTQRTTR